MPKREQIEPMFSSISSYYDVLNDFMTFGLHRFWKKKAVLKTQLKKGDSYLDLCSGTGDLAFFAAKIVGLEGKVIAADFCSPMLEMAKKRASQKKLTQIEFLKADVQKLPLNEHTFHAVTIAFGIRNTEDPTQVLRESYRVLKKEGIFVCLEASSIKNPFLSFFASIFTQKIIPFIVTFFGKNTEAYQYLPSSVKNFWTSEEMVKKFNEVGFLNIKTQKFLFGATTLYSGQKK